MRKKNVATIFILALCFMVTTANAGDDLMKSAQNACKPIPKSPHELKGNPSSPEKEELGKMLYFDPRLSRSSLISCNSCHNVGMGGDDFQETSTGHGWQKGPRNAPTVLNAVFNIAQFWDGRASDLKEQAKGPVQASVEMLRPTIFEPKSLKLSELILGQLIKTIKHINIGWLDIFIKINPY